MAAPSGTTKINLQIGHWMRSLCKGVPAGRLCDGLLCDGVPAGEWRLFVGCSSSDSLHEIVEKVLVDVADEPSLVVNQEPFFFDGKSKQTTTKIIITVTFDKSIKR